MTSAGIDHAAFETCAMQELNAENFDAGLA